jgi:hypothetical protein
MARGDEIPAAADDGAWGGGGERSRSDAAACAGEVSMGALGRSGFRDLDALDDLDLSPVSGAVICFRSALRARPGPAREALWIDPTADAVREVYRSWTGIRPDRPTDHATAFAGCRVSRPPPAACFLTVGVRTAMPL